MLRKCWYLCYFLFSFHLIFHIFVQQHPWFPSDKTSCFGIIRHIHTNMFVCTVVSIQSTKQIFSNYICCLWYAVLWMFRFTCVYYIYILCQCLPGRKWSLYLNVVNYIWYILMLNVCLDYWNWIYKVLDTKL